jgi:type VI secretion system protein ImpL
VSFTVTPLELDQRSSAFILEIGGETLRYRHGPPQSLVVKWPGSAAGGAAASFESAGANRLVGAFDGQWAWFRLLDAVRVQHETDVRSVVTVEKDGHQARFRIDASSIRNPYSRADLQQLRCG